MTSGELKILMALDKLGEYVQNGIPSYKSINVSFYQDQSDDSVVYTELSNNSGYTFDMQGDGPGSIQVITDIPDYRNAQIFMSPLTHPSDYCTMQLISADPYVFNLVSINTGGSEDARGFGANGTSPVSLEIRIYPEPA